MSSTEQFELKDLIEKEINLRVANKLIEKMDQIKQFKIEQEEELNLSKKNLEEDKTKIAQEYKELEKLKLKHQKKVKEHKINLEDAHKKLKLREEAILNSLKDCHQDSFISVNIGGTVFQTLKSTLTGISPFFANIFSDKWIQSGNKAITDKDGNIFIDRSPKYFEQLLNIARNGGNILEINNLIKKVKKIELDQGKDFIRTINYFGIDYELPPVKNKCNLSLNQKISIYWRGDRRYYSGIIESIKNVIVENKKEIEIIVKYNDGDSWKYLLSKLEKSSSPIKINERIDANWVHCGVSYGSTKL